MDDSLPSQNLTTATIASVNVLLKANFAFLTLQLPIHMMN